MPVKNRSHVVTLMAALIFAFAMIAVISPAALAGRSEVYFSDVNGNPKAEWKVGEVLYITVVSHDENRDSDEVELIGARSTCKTHTGVDVPCVEIWDPNTKDSETNLGQLVLVETGINTGIFRSQTGIVIFPNEADATPENLRLEVYQGDTIMVRYQSPSDANDIALDIAKIGTTRGIISITTQGGQENPVWQVGEQIWVTVVDPDLNVDPLKVDKIKDVALWNPRCVWDVIERAGKPRTDQPEPKPCGTPVGFDSRLKDQFPGNFNDSLTLVETGPNTGVFRNVNGITLTDQLGPKREFPTQPTADFLYVNHKDTIVAFYRLPTIMGVEVTTRPEVETRTDPCIYTKGLSCEQIVPTQVTPGAEFEVTINITPTVDTKAVVLKEILPSGFSFVNVEMNPNGAIVGESAGTIRAFWNGNVVGGQTLSITFKLRAGAALGDFTLRGTITTREPQGAGVLRSTLSVVAATSQGLSLSPAAQQTQTGDLRVELTASPTQVAAGGTFTVRLNVTPLTANTGFIAARVNFDGLKVENKGSFTRVSGNELVGIVLGPVVDRTETLEATLRCTASESVTLSAQVIPQNVPAVNVSATVTCGAAGPEQPTEVGFHRGKAGPNDPQDFALAVAKVGHHNPAQLFFTDKEGNKIQGMQVGDLNTLPLGSEFFITLIDDDQNMDSDHVETVCVQVFNVNGGREGSTPNVAVDPNSPNACKEDHVRDLFMWKNGVKLVETGPDTGIFRNPNALKIIPICEWPETEEYNFDTDPKDTKNTQIHKIGWSSGIPEQTVLKDCHPSTLHYDEGRREFGIESSPTHDPTSAGSDVAGIIAAHAGDVVYVVYQDQLVDPFDIMYATALVQDFESIGELAFINADGSPADTFKVGQDIFIRLVDNDRNISSDVVDKVKVLVLDRNSGDWEDIVLEETGADTGEFINAEGLSLQPATSPGVIRINNDRLEIFDRDTIEVHYQDNFNSKDYRAAWIRLVPQPEPGPGVPAPAVSETRFTDAQGREVADYAVGDTVYVTVSDDSQNVSSAVQDVIFGAIVVTNLRTGQSVTVDATETGPDTGLFISDPITTGATGSGAMLEVEDGDALEATYTDPADPTDTSSDTIQIVTRVFSCTDARNWPNPFTISTTFEAIGTGIAAISVGVYDLSGRLVAQLTASGTQVPWDGRTDLGESLSSGVYLYQITCSGRAGETATLAVEKLVILK